MQPLAVDPAGQPSTPSERGARQRAARVRLLAMDVDGTLTDGGLLIGADAEVAKAFSVRDGFGLTLLCRAGIELVLITGRQSAIVERRATDLGIVRVHQSVKDKLAMLQHVCRECGIGLDEAAFIGDDWPDLPLMRHAAFACAPPGAHIEVRARARHITTARAGYGAAREFCDLLLVSTGRYAALLHGPQRALDGAR